MQENKQEEQEWRILHGKLTNDGGHNIFRRIRREDMQNGNAARISIKSWKRTYRRLKRRSKRQKIPPRKRKIP